MTPRVSVVLPCFRAEPFVEEAVRSILGQTVRDLEIVAVDDGSRDRTREILSAIAAEDPRLRVLANERNLGLVPTLNRGLAETRGAFVARMDADDVSLPDRLERQLRLLEKRPDLDVVGGGIELMDRSGRAVGSRPVRFTEPETAHFFAHFAIPIANVTALGRAAAFQAHPYRESPETLYCEDYEFWARLLRAGVRLGNLPGTLVRVRVHRESVSRAHEETQIANFVALSREHRRAVGAPPLSDGGQRALVARIGPTIRPEYLRAGLAALRALSREALARAEREEVRAEIARTAAEQELDILLQGALRASPSARVAALARLAAAGPRFAFGPAGPYLRRKLRGGREAGLVR